MKVDGSLGTDLAKAGANAREAEAAGYAGVWTAETSHDPFLPLLLGAEQAAHHQALLDGVEPSRTAYARARPGDAGDLEHVAHRREARVPGRVLHAHADDPVLHPCRIGP